MRWVYERPSLVILESNWKGRTWDLLFHTLLERIFFRSVSTSLQCSVFEVLRLSLIVLNKEHSWLDVLFFRDWRPSHFQLFLTNWRDWRLESHWVVLKIEISRSILFHLIFEAQFYISSSCLIFDFFILSNSNLYCMSCLTNFRKHLLGLADLFLLNFRCSLEVLHCEQGRCTLRWNLVELRTNLIDI